MYNVIATGSTGNAVIYHKSIMVDCGVPFSAVKPYLYDLQIVLLTHEHGDHLNLSTLVRLQSERPTLRFGCCEWIYPMITGKARNIDLYEIGKRYDYGAFQISPVKLYHDVENCGYRIFKDSTKIFHATDTAHLNGIEARDYDLYAIEANYDEDTVFATIQRKQEIGEFSHEKGAVNSHLSEQQANDFIFRNGNANSKILRLHEHRNGK